MSAAREAVMRRYGPTTYRQLRNLVRALKGETNSLEEQTKNAAALLEEINIAIVEEIRG